MFEKIHINFEGKESIAVKGLGKYSLSDTLECGQCFRYERVDRDDGIAEYVIVSRRTLIHVAQREAGELIFIEAADCDMDGVISTLFSLELELSKIKEDIVKRTESEWLKHAAEYSEGIAILSQDPWEALFSFIVSQNNNIPRIRKIVKQMCVSYGVNLSEGKECPLRKGQSASKTDCEKCGVCYTFPSPADVCASPELLLAGKPGFRYKYLIDAAEKVMFGEINLDSIRAAGSYDYTVSELKKIKGVGDKVASCAALFGFGNLEAFPIDVWMKKAIDTYFDGELDPASLGKYAGVAQQYIFNYIRNVEGKE